MLGSTGETVSRCMSDLKRENLVEYRNGKILVKDRKKCPYILEGCDFYHIYSFFYMLFYK